MASSSHREAEGELRIHCTASVFQWLSDLGAVRPNDGSGYPSGGIGIAGQPAATLCYGGLLLDCLSRLLPPDVTVGIQMHRGAARKDASAPSERLYAWGTLLTILSRLAHYLQPKISTITLPSQAIVDDERALAVACDTSVIANIIHRLASFTTLSGVSKAALPSPRMLPGVATPQEHPCVRLLATLGCRHFRMSVEQMTRLFTHEQERWSYLLSSVPPDQENRRVPSSSQADGENAQCIVGWLSDVSANSNKLGIMLRGDNWGVRVALNTIGAGLNSASKSVVLAACKAVGAVAAESSGTELWMWLVGARERGGEGLAHIVSAYTTHDRDAHVCRSLVWLLCAASKPEHIASIVTVDLPLRLSYDAGYCMWMCDTLAAFGDNLRCRQELEWHGIVPFLLDLSLRELHVSLSDQAKAASLDMLVELWRIFSQAVVASADMVQGILECVRTALSSAQTAQMRCLACESSCRLLGLMIAQRCTVAGQLYKIIALALEESYADALVRNNVQASMLKVIGMSGLIPLKPLTRMLPSLPQSHGYNKVDVDFWAALAGHPRIEPAETLVLLELLSTACLTDPALSLQASKHIGALGESLERHAPIRIFLSRFLYAATSVVRDGGGSDEGWENDPEEEERRRRSEACEGAIEELAGRERLQDMARSCLEQALELERSSAARPTSIRRLQRLLAIASAPAQQKHTLPAVKPPALKPPHTQLPTILSSKPPESIRAAAPPQITRAISPHILPMRPNNERAPVSSNIRKMPEEDPRTRGHDSGFSPPMRGLDESDAVSSYAVSPIMMPAAYITPTRSESVRVSVDSTIPMPSQSRQSPSIIKASGYESDSSAAAPSSSHASREPSNPWADEGRSAGPLTPIDIELPAARAPSEGPVVVPRKEQPAAPRAEQPAARVTAVPTYESKKRAAVARSKQDRGASSKVKDVAEQTAPLNVRRALSEALRLRGFGSAMDLYVFLEDRAGAGGMTQAEGLKSVQVLKLAPGLEKEVLRAYSVSGGGSKAVSARDWGAYLMLPAVDSEDKVADADALVAEVRGRKRETAAAFKRLMAEAEKILKRRLAADLDDALAKVAQQQLVAHKAPEMVLASQQDRHQQASVRKPSQKRRPRVVREAAAQEAAPAAAAPAPPATLLEKMILDQYLKGNVLLTCEADSDDTWLLSNPRVYCMLPRQLMRAEHLDKACKCVCSIYFMQQVIKYFGVHYALDTLHQLHQCLHDGYGRDHVDDYLDFVENNADALLNDPSAIFELAKLELDKSKVFQDATRAIILGDTAIRQAQSRVHRLNESTVPVLVKAVAYSRAQRSLVRLQARGITRCFTKAQRDKYMKTISVVSVCCEKAQNELIKTPLEEQLSSLQTLLNTSTTSHESYGLRPDVHTRAFAFFDVMDVMLRALPSAPPPSLKEQDEDDFAGNSEEQTIETLLGAWGSVRVYLGGSGGADLHTERKLLKEFVLPALRVQCQGLSLDFGWCERGDGGKEEGGGSEWSAQAMVSRMEGLDLCRANIRPPRDSDTRPPPKAPLAVLLLGERMDGVPPEGGASLDDEATRLLAKHAKYASGSVPMVQAELDKAFLSRVEPSTFVFLRQAAFGEGAGETDAKSRALLEKDSKSSALLRRLQVEGGREACEVVRDAAEKKAIMMGEVTEKEEGEDKEPWHVTLYRASYAGIEKTAAGDERLRMSGCELMGVQAFTRLWGVLRFAYPPSGHVPVFDGEENTQEATRFGLCKRCVYRAFRQKELQACVDFVHSRVTHFVEGAPALLLVGSHGSGLSAILATIPTQIADEDRFRVVYFKQLAWHPRSQLVWFACSSVSDTYAFKYSWKMFVDRTVALTSDSSQSVVLVLDGITPEQQEEVIDAVYRVQAAGGSCVVIMSGAQPHPRAEQVMVPDLTPDESVGLMRATLTDMTHRLPEQAHFDYPGMAVSVCESLESLPGPRSLAAGNTLFLRVAAAYAVATRGQRLSKFKADLVTVWSDMLLPLWEAKHGKEAVMWTLLALHYEPFGLRLSQMGEQPSPHKGLAHTQSLADRDKLVHPKEVLRLEDLDSSVSAAQMALLDDLEPFLYRCFAPGGQSFVLECLSLKEAIVRRYLDPWKKAEESAVKPSVSKKADEALAKPFLPDITAESSYKQKTSPSARSGILNLPVYNGSSSGKVVRTNGSSPAKQLFGKEDKKNQVAAGGKVKGAGSSRATSDQDADDNQDARWDSREAAGEDGAAGEGGDHSEEEGEVVIQRVLSAVSEERSEAGMSDEADADQGYGVEAAGQRREGRVESEEAPGRGAGGNSVNSQDVGDGRHDDSAGGVKAEAMQLEGAGVDAAGRGAAGEGQEPGKETVQESSDAKADGVREEDSTPSAAATASQEDASVPVPDNDAAMDQTPETAAAVSEQPKEQSSVPVAGQSAEECKESFVPLSGQTVEGDEEPPLDDAKLEQIMEENLARNVEGGQLAGFCVGVEGNVAKFEKYVEMSKVLKWEDAKHKKLDLEDNTQFVFGGNVTDKGTGDMRVLKLLLALKKRHPDRVHLLIGPREGSKLRFASELSEEALGSDVMLKDEAFPYWVPEAQRVTPEAYLQREGVENTKAGRLKWMLDETMDARGAFERRRKELAEDGKKSVEEVTDEEVVESYTELVTPGHKHSYIIQYLDRAEVTRAFGNTLFVHGAVTESNVGSVPGEAARVNVENWSEELNNWAFSQLQTFKGKPNVGGTSQDRSAWGMIDLCVSRDSVVGGSWFGQDGREAGLTSKVSRYLAGGGFRQIVCAQGTRGGCPSIFVNGPTRVVCAESIWSEAGMSEVLTYPDGRVSVHGVSGLYEIEYDLGVPGKDAGSTADTFIGKKVADGKEVRAKTKSGKYLVYDPEQRQVDLVEEQAVMG